MIQRNKLAAWLHETANDEDGRANRRTDAFVGRMIHTARVEMIAKQMIGMIKVVHATALLRPGGASWKNYLMAGENKKGELVPFTNLDAGWLFKKHPKWLMCGTPAARRQLRMRSPTRLKLKPEYKVWNPIEKKFEDSWEAWPSNSINSQESEIGPMYPATLGITEPIYVLKHEYEFEGNPEEDPLVIEGLQYESWSSILGGDTSSLDSMVDDAGGIDEFQFLPGAYVPEEFYVYENTGADEEPETVTLREAVYNIETDLWTVEEIEREIYSPINIFRPVPIDVSPWMDETDAWNNTAREDILNKFESLF